MILKYSFRYVLVLFVLRFTAVAQEDPPVQEDSGTSSWQSSPNNWINSKFNYDNSEMNYSNSLKSFANQPDNINRLNIVNFLGFTIGYAVPKKDGGVNYFDNDGVRIGYSPDGGVTQYDLDGDPAKFEVKKGS